MHETWGSLFIRHEKTVDQKLALPINDRGKVDIQRNNVPQQKLLHVLALQKFHIRIGISK